MNVGPSKRTINSVLSSPMRFLQSPLKYLPIARFSNAFHFENPFFGLRNLDSTRAFSWDKEGFEIMSLFDQLSSRYSSSCNGFNVENCQYLISEQSLKEKHFLSMNVSFPIFCQKQRFPPLSQS